QGDDDQLNLGIGEELVVIFVESNLGAGVVAVVVVEASARAVGIALAFVLEDADLVAGTDVAIGYEFDVSGVVLADQYAPLGAAPRQRAGRKNCTRPSTPARRPVRSVARAKSANISIRFLLMYR